MTPVELLVRSSLPVLAGLAAAWLLRGRSAALRHAVLAVAVLAGAAAPLAGLAVPAWRVELPRVLDGREQPAPVSLMVTAAAPARPDLPRQENGLPASWPLMVWAAGFIASASALLAGFTRLSRVSAESRPLLDGRWTAMADRIAGAYGLSRPVTLLQTTTPDLLATYGIRRARVMLPAAAPSWDDERVRVVLAHELAHVARRDWPIQMAAEAARCVYWFNPVFWLACRSLRREGEQACDDVVLGGGVAADRYASLLIDLARRTRRPGSAWRASMRMARPSTLERRITAMLNPRLDRTPLSRRAAGLALAFAVVVMLPAAALRATQSPQPLVGAIYDVTGAVLPEVRLKLTDAQDFTWQATTDSSGRFEFPPVQPGQYVLEASLPGFGSLRHEFALKTERDWDRAITLSVGQVQESIVVSAARAPEASPSAPAGPRQVRVGGNIRPPVKVKNVNPTYPPSMREAGRQGRVQLDAVIGTDGAVHSLRVLGAHVHPDLAVAAVDAVRQWQFRPTLLNGEAVEVVMRVAIDFDLD